MRCLGCCHQRTRLQRCSGYPRFWFIHRASVFKNAAVPFVSYITPKKLTYYLNTESTYNWERKDWSVPINFGANQSMKVGNQIMQVGGGLRYWAESSEFRPEGWGVRLNIIFVFPK
jgi:hypothetical protein